VGGYYPSNVTYYEPFYFFLVLDYSCAGPGLWLLVASVYALDVYLIRLIHAMPICWPRFWVNVVGGT
jgi:hypothetical protein